jgi:hypothetical protein
MILLPPFVTARKKIARGVASVPRLVLASLGFALAFVSPAQAWVTLDLPNLTSSPEHGGALAFSHLSDGRLIYGNNNALFLQNSFGSAATTAFSTPPNVDPSFVTVLNDTTAVVGGGQNVNTPVYQFNPSSPANPNYTTNVTLQNFSAAPASASSYYVAGANDNNGNNAVSYVTLGGAQQWVVDPAGEFSAGLTVDKGGNVYVGDNDNNSVYEFTAAQVLNAVTQSTVLTLANGLLLHTFAADVVGSLAVDGSGRIWATGFGDTGLFWYNPQSGNSGSFNPEDTADHPFSAYTLGTFSANGTDYVSYIWQSDFSNGSTVVYGYDTAQNVPEPATSALLAAVVVVGAAAWWKRRRKTGQA